jgi:hypothetical protein
MARLFFWKPGNRRSSWLRCGGSGPGLREKTAPDSALSSTIRNAVNRT